jgi:predicted transcriptional regulator
MLDIEWYNRGMGKTAKQLERYFKGAANHRRIDILFIVEKNDGITVDGIAGILKANFKTISQHTQSLVHAGLLNKKYVGRKVTHSLSPYGKFFVKFMQTF